MLFSKYSANVCILEISCIIAGMKPFELALLATLFAVGVVVLIIAIRFMLRLRAGDKEALKEQKEAREELQRRRNIRKEKKVIKRLAKERRKRREAEDPDLIGYMGLDYMNK